MLSRFCCLSLIGWSLLSPAYAQQPLKRATAAKPEVRPAQATAASAKSRKSAAIASRPSTTVIIDAGHGGHDRGGIPRQRVSEKTMTLDVAQRLQRALAAEGYRTIMTRNSDVFVPLGRRTAIANSYRDAIFLSVHFNSARRAGANGIETYFYSRDSLPLASAVHYHVARGAPSTNRGVRRRGYYVLRRTRIPAVLVECGFLTNPTEARLAQNAAYRQKLAEQIALGVRTRSMVRSSTTGTAVAGTVPLQPFIDQTRVRRTKRSAKKRPRRKSKSKKSSTWNIKANNGLVTFGGSAPRHES